jgi:hypothetical protein
MKPEKNYAEQGLNLYQNELMNRPITEIKKVQPK